MADGPLNLIDELKARIEAELAPGERVLYAGRPDWRAERGTLLLIFALGLFMSAVAVPLAAATIAAALGQIPFDFNGEPASPMVALAFCLLTVPIASLGGLVLALPFLSIWRSRRAAHLVTDRRFFTVYGGGWPSTESQPIDSVNFVRRRGAGGWRSLEIAYGVWRDADNNPRPLTITWPGIPDLERAEAALTRGRV